MQKGERAVVVGDTIRSAALSDAINVGDLEEGVSLVKSWGVDVELGQHIKDKVDDFSAGSREVRYAELMWLLAHQWAWCAGGGYAVDDLLVPYEQMGKPIERLWKESRTVMAGYSDMTFLAAMAFKIGVPFVMGANLGSLSEWDDKGRTTEMMKEVWMGRGVNDIGPEARWSVGNVGRTSGVVFGGNLSVAGEALGSNWDWLKADTDHRKIVLAIEELCVTEVDVMRRIRQIFAHPAAPEKIGGLIVGRMVDIDSWDYPIYSRTHPLRTRIVDFARTVDPKMPVAFLDDFGHAEWGWEWWWKLKRLGAKSHTFCPITNGLGVEFKVEKNGECSLQYEEDLWR